MMLLSEQLSMELTISLHNMRRVRVHQSERRSFAAHLMAEASPHSCTSATALRHACLRPTGQSCRKRTYISSGARVGKPFDSPKLTNGQQDERSFVLGP
jgi:hypothetical protein